MEPPRPTAAASTARDFREPNALRRFFGQTSLGVWVVLLLAVISSAALFGLRHERHGTIQYWIFAKQHRLIYQSMIDRWNREHPSQQVEMSLLNVPVMTQRMMSGFLSGTPVADVLEVERQSAGGTFTGPLENVGFVDLTDRLKNEGLLDGINAPSFGPWTSRGRIFGIPHDVHPVMLMYRADLVEAAHIDVTKIETWDDYFRVMRPLMQDLDHDGHIDRYLLNASHTDPNTVELLLLQAGGALFDMEERPVVNSAINVRTLARLVPWFVGPARTCRFAQADQSASAQQIILDGLVVGVLTPDWLAGTMKQQVPALSGKVKLMPLPAFDRGGKRTSVWGGTMLGISKASPTQAADWEFAKAIYLSREMAEALYRATYIVSPIKANWNNPIYDEPNAFFAGQPVGRLYLNLAPDVPRRPSSPYNLQAIAKLAAALGAIVNYAESHQVYDPVALEPVVQRELDTAQRELSQMINRNVFLSTGP
jgi:arabinosaccharide transport system substrate-binding protein